MYDVCSVGPRSPAVPEEADGIRESDKARLVHLDVEDCSEESLRQQSYAIKNQLGQS